MQTKDPIQLTDDAWVQISAGPCAGQVLSGQAWIRHAAAAPAAIPNPAALIDTFEFDGHLVGHGNVKTPTGLQTIKESHFYYESTEPTFARACNADGAIIIVTGS